MTNNYSSKYSLLMSRLADQLLSTKMKAIQILLLSDLNYLDEIELLNFINNLLDKESLDLNILEHEIEKYNEIVKPLLDRLQERIAGINYKIGNEQPNVDNVYNKLSTLNNYLNETNKKIIAAGQLVDKKCYSADQAVELFTHYYEVHQNAMNKSAEIIIQRMMESFNPDTLEDYIDNSVIKVGPLKKAAMFDAMKEKYEQVQMYQKEGKMLRDFKVHYKAELKAFKKDDQT